MDELIWEKNSKTFPQPTKPQDWSGVVDDFYQALAYIKLYNEAIKKGNYESSFLTGAFCKLEKGGTGGLL